MSESDETAETSPPSPAGSERSSAASSTRDELIGDAGPGFVPGAAPEAEQPGQAPDEPPPIDFALEVSEEQVRAFLRNVGDGLHAVAGVGELDWVFTDTDQDRLGPPLARLSNRYPALAMVAGRSDEAAVAIGMGLYTWRSLLERQAVLKAAEQRPRATAPPSERPAPAAGPRPAPPPPQTPPARPPGPDGPDGPSIELPEDYVTAADRLRATRPEE
jgi:hypothetical protein